jgi:hypothetical protein
MATEPAQLALPSGEPPADSSTAVYGIVALGIASAVAVGALFGAWLTLRSGTRVWPPKGVVPLNYFGTTLSVTGVIVIFAAWWGLFGIVKGERRQAVLGFGLTLFMQAAMVNLMTYVIRYSGLSPRTNAYSVMYYAISVTVIAILACGIGVSLVALLRTLGGQVSKAEPGMGWAAAWYATFTAVCGYIMYALVWVVK